MATLQSFWRKAKQFIQTYDVALDRFVRDVSWFISVCTTFSSVVFPISTGVFSLAKFTLPDWAVVTFLLAWFATSFVALYGTWRVQRLTNQVNPEFITELRDYLSGDKTLNKIKLGRLIAQQTAIEVSLIWLRILLLRETANLENDLDDILFPLVKARHAALGFSTDEDVIWNFVVYVFNSQTGMMEIKWRRCIEESDNFIKQNRNWPLGHGHPGITYSLEGPWIVGDAQTLTFPGLFSDNPIDKARDQRIYRSFMTIPIGGFDGNKVSQVTLTITSSTLNQFSDYEYHTFCNIYRKILALYFVRFPVAI